MLRPIWQQPFFAPDPSGDAPPDAPASTAVWARGLAVGPVATDATLVNSPTDIVEPGGAS